MAKIYKNKTKGAGAEKIDLLIRYPSFCQVYEKVDTPNHEISNICILNRLLVIQLMLFVCFG